VRVLDFGLAHVEAMAGLTSHSVLMGTPEYMAPETAAGDPVDGRADLYSLGVLWFELATGALPFPSGSPLEHLKQITEHDGPAPAGEGVDDAETAIVGRLLRRSPGERYASADEVREALARREGTVERALALPRRVCAVCGADEPTGPGFCLACGADVLTVASAPGDSVLVLTRHEEGVAPLLELPPLMGRFGAEVDPAEVGGEVAPAPPVVVLKGVDAGFARRVQQDLLPAGFTCEVRRLAEENFDLLRGRHTPPAVYVGALLLGWGAACFAAHAVYGTVGLVLAFAAGPPMGWLLVRQTHLFLSPLFRPVDETDDPTAMAMSAHYRQFLERTRSGSLRRLGATLMARASLLLARLDDEAVAPTARRSLTGLAVDATRRGLDTLAALQPVDELLQSADARHIWEELEQTEARIRRDDEGDGGSPDREQAEGLERELRQLSDLEHERTRQIQKVLRLAVRLEAARAEVRGVEAPDEEQLSEIGRRIELDAALLADAVAETEAAVASRSPGRDST